MRGNVIVESDGPELTGLAPVGPNRSWMALRCGFVHAAAEFIGGSAGGQWPEAALRGRPGGGRTEDAWGGMCGG